MVKTIFNEIAFSSSILGVMNLPFFRNRCWKMDWREIEATRISSKRTGNR